MNDSIDITLLHLQGQLLFILIMFGCALYRLFRTCLSIDFVHFVLIPSYEMI